MPPSFDSQQAAPPTFISDCNELTSVLEEFPEDFGIAAGQTVTLSFGTCSVGFTSGGLKSDTICGSPHVRSISLILTSCGADELGGTTICNSGLNISILDLVGLTYFYNVHLKPVTILALETDEKNGGMAAMQPLGTVSMTVKATTGSPDPARVDFEQWISPVIAPALPVVGAGDWDWANAVARAKKFVASLTLEEKNHVTAGIDIGGPRTIPV
ncbi:hypothetical protein B0H19DRAFT_1371383 [Mycena capillaripes]|nr:hypothetical protein B0H19DRAFT_1371383 [Mycena capillaripes]